MDLVERYLGAIARNLPDRQKADVTAELRDVLLSQIEEEEARLGRPLIREEVEALLVRFGHPLTVSGRYRKVQHLIGPEVFPFWWAAVKATTAVILGIWVVLAALVAIAGDQIDLRRGADDPSLVGVLIFAFGAITLACALIERFGKAAMLQRWKPGQLPPPEGKAKSRFELAVEIGAGVVFILWWVGVIQFRDVLPHYEMSVELAPIWRQMHWPILAYAVLDLLANLSALVSPGRVARNRGLSLVRHLAGLAVVAVIYQAGHWVVVNWDAWSPDVHATVQRNFDLGMRIGVGGTLLVYLALAGVDLWRLWQMREANRGAAGVRPA